MDFKIILKNKRIDKENHFNKFLAEKFVRTATVLGI